MRTDRVERGMEIQRSSPPGSVYSVALRARDGVRPFEDMHFGRYCVGFLCALRHVTGYPVLAYCLLPDRVHMLVVARPGGSVDAFVRRWKMLCTLEWRRRTGRGNFWGAGQRDQARTRATALSGEMTELLESPVVAGLVSKAEDYPLSGSLP